MKAEIDAIVDTFIDPQAPGVAVAVMKDGVILHCQGYGRANLEWDQAIASDTVFCLASLTKPFTATAVLLLEKQGKLSLDAPLSTYLPDYPTYGQGITLTHLLTHTSGIKNYVSLEGFFERTSKVDRTPDELVALFKDLPLDFEPGTQYRYSNSGYCLLGKIIEAVSGMNYGAFVQTHIFQPLGMRQSYYMSNELTIPHRASGYVKTDQGYQHAPYLSMTLPYAAGSLGSSLEDLIRWEKGLQEGRLLDLETQERMYSPLRLADGRRENYGLGWGIEAYRQHRVVHHAGGIPGFSTFLVRFLEDALTIILLSNLAGFDARELARQLSILVLDLPSPQRSPIAPDEHMLEMAIGTYENPAYGAVEVKHEGQSLLMRGPVTCHLLPLSEARYYSAEDEDVEVRFEAATVSGYQRATIIEPFYWFAANRVKEKSAHE